jgi:hypothetical protein
MGEPSRIQGSLHDPTNAVISVGDVVLRGLDARTMKVFQRLIESSFYSDAVGRGSVVGTRFVDPIEGWASVVEHERLAVITWPYEWSFSMLKDAALLELDLAIEALRAGFMMKDGTPFNVQFRGSLPVFIDIGSFGVQRRSTPWLGYRQFVETFLGPLLIQSRTDLPARSLLRSSNRGLSVHQTRRLLSFWAKLRPSVFMNVVLHSWLSRRHEDDESDVAGDIASAGMSNKVVEAQLRKLRSFIAGIDCSLSRSTWSGYSERDHYQGADLQRKADFVRQVATMRSRGLVVDLGANDGYFSRIVAENADAVIAVDGDEVVVDRLYRQLRDERNSIITPACVDLSDPMGGSGWMGGQRDSIMDRWRCDLVLALALIHHVVISDSVPIPDFVRMLRFLAPEAIVEFPTEDDPKVKRLIRNKAGEPIHPYSREEFERSIDGVFRIARSEVLPSGSRVLYHLDSDL